MSMSTRICSKCHTPLAPSERFCGNCGTPYIEPDTIDPTQYSNNFDPYQTPSASNQQAKQSSPYASTSYGPDAVPPPPPSNSGYTTPQTYNPNPSPSYNPTYNPNPTPNPSSSPSYNPTPAYTPNPAPSYTPNVNTGYNPASGTYGPPPGGGIYAPGPQFPQFPPTQPPKKSKVGLVLAIVGGILVLLVVLCGGGLYALGKLGQSTANTATPTVAATSTVASTPTAAPSPAAQALFSDKFADNSHNWDVTNDNGFSSSISNNVLTMQEANHKVYEMYIPTKQSYSDFAISATFTLVQGDQNDSVGLSLREASDAYQGYYFNVYGDDTYDIQKLYYDSSQKKQDAQLVEATTSSALNTKGTVNTMKVIMKGQNILLLFNGTLIQSLTDSSFSNGNIGLYAQNGTSSNGVKVTFSDIEIDAAPATLPS